MQNSLTFAMRMVMVVVLLVLVSASLIALRNPVQGVSQDTKRVLRRQHPGEGEPVLIKRVTVDGKQVSFKKEFPADDEWFKSLAMTVWNRSSQPIAFLSIGLQFPQPSGRVSVFYLRFGGADETYATSNVNPLLPGASVELKFDSQQQQVLGQFLTETGIVNVSQIEVSLRTVIFTDGSKWEGGRVFRQMNGKWSVVKSGQQPTYVASDRRKRAHMSACRTYYTDVLTCESAHQSLVVSTTKMC